MTKKYRSQARLTRTDIVRAFSAPGLSRQETMSAVRQYMGDAPVPPSWSYASVRGILGHRIARLWARHLRHRPAGAYRDLNSGRWLHPVVQTAYDFGSTPEELANTKSPAPPKVEKKFAGMLVDEYHL